MYRDASTKRSSRFAPRTHIRIIFFLPTAVSISRRRHCRCCLVRSLLPRLDILLQALDVAFQPLDGGLKRLHIIVLVGSSMCFNACAICFAFVGWETHVDVLAQQLVRNPVLVDDVVVQACAGEGGAEKESKDAVRPLSVLHPL
jgi:hypothetical protein